MKDREFNNLLALYLAGELDDVQTAEFHAAIQMDARRRRLFNEMQSAADALEASVISDEEALEGVESLSLQQVYKAALEQQAPAKTRGSGFRLWGVALRVGYAAAIVIAFGMGYFVRGWNLPESESARPSVQLNIQDSLDERIIEHYLEVSKNYPHSSSFSRTLLALSRK